MRPVQGTGVQEAEAMRSAERRKGLIRFAALLVSLLLLSSCGSTSNLPDLEALYGKASETEASAEQVIFRSIYNAEAENLNYLVTTNYADFDICANTVDCLVEYDPYGNVQPGLAESWESNADHTVWTFHIRKGVSWVDKRGAVVAEVKADDWVAAAHYVNDAKNGSGSQYMYSTGSVVQNAQAYYDYTQYLLLSENGTKNRTPDGEPLTPVPEVSPWDIGVSAADDYTLIYTLERPCPFFLSVLTYPSYMPVNRAYLEREGERFGTGATHLLYNGPYLLDVYQSLDKHVLVRNPEYWDNEHVYLDRIEETYLRDAQDRQMELYRNGEVDFCEISMDHLEDWLNDVELQSEVHAQRPDLTYSYFYSFNFDPRFDQEYEPDNWRKAVENESFRKSLMYAINRLSVLSVYEPYTPEILLNKTICPRNFISVDGTDYTALEPLNQVSEKDFYDPVLARRFKEKALPELEKSGVSLPVKVLMPYNPSLPNWDLEAETLKAGLELILGTDYIEVITLKGPETAFLSAIRRSGNYAFMKCNWGADYADPQTWTEPFAEGNSFGCWDRCRDAGIKALYEEWSGLKDTAALLQDTGERYALFAKAEAMLIDHAIVVPFSISQGNAYVASRLHELEGQFAPFGFVLQRYKLLHLYDRSMGIEEFRSEYAKWERERSKRIIKEGKQ